MLRAFLAPSRTVSSAEAVPVDLVRFGRYLSACQAILEGAPVRGHNTSQVHHRGGLCRRKGDRPSGPTVGGGGRYLPLARDTERSHDLSRRLLPPRPGPAVQRTASGQNPRGRVTRSFVAAPEVPSRWCRSFCRKALRSAAERGPTSGADGIPASRASRLSKWAAHHRPSRIGAPFRLATVTTYVRWAPHESQRTSGGVESSRLVRSAGATADVGFGWYFMGPTLRPGKRVRITRKGEPNHPPLSPSRGSQLRSIGAEEGSATTEAHHRSAGLRAGAPSLRREPIALSAETWWHR